MFASINYTRLNKENRNEIHTGKLSDYYVDEDVDVVGVEQLVAVLVQEHVHNHLRGKFDNLVCRQHSILG